MKINITYEQALAKASPSLRRKMEHTRDVILKAVPLALRYDEKGFWTGFSGGKDSQALYHMMQLCNVPFYAYFSPTTCDPPENIRFIKTNYPEVEFVKVSQNIYDVFKSMRVLPSMKIRWCCSHFKERGGEGKVVCTGVRKAESVKRSKRNEIEVSGRKFSGHIDEFDEWQEKRIRKKMKNLNQDQFSEAKESEVRCISGKDKILLNPIIEWSEQDVWEFLNKVVEVPHCELYDQGWTRIGCICCPMATTKNILRDVKRWPHVKEKWIKAIMDVRRESILQNTPPPSANSLKDNELPPPVKVWRDEIDKGLLSLQSLHSQRIVPPPQKIHTRRIIGRDVPIPQSLPNERIRQSADKQDISNGVSEWGGAKDISKTTPRNMVGKFLDSDNGEASAVVAEYDEARERAIADAIFSWWISKKSFSRWFAETYQQGRLFDDSDFEI